MVSIYETARHLSFFLSLLVTRLSRLFYLSFPSLAPFSDRLLGRVSIFWDDVHLIREVNADTDKKHHINTSGNFIVTDNVIHDRILNSICEEAENFDGDFFLIELARAGKDLQGVRDMSYSRISKFITKTVLDNSIFIRLECSYAERLKRNEFRNVDRPDGKYREASLEIMQRFSYEDDFYNWAKSIGRPIIVLDNS